MFQKFPSNNLSLIHIFLDVTDYLKLYKKSDYELAEEILKTIQEKTGLTATCGIGPNPVSYTHLDVYKRQLKFLANACVSVLVG